MVKHLYKSLLLPITATHLLIQDRRGHKPPDFGFFGGKLEPGETPLQTLIRETQEELNLNLTELDLIYHGEFPGTQSPTQIISNYVYTWQFNGDTSLLSLLEGKAMLLLPYKQAYRTITLDPDKAIIKHLFLDQQSHS